VFEVQWITFEVLWIVFEVLGIMFVVQRVTFNLTLKGDKVRGECRELHKPQLHDLYIPILSAAGLSRQTSFGLLDGLTQFVSSSHYVIGRTTVSHLTRTELEMLSSSGRCYLDGRLSCFSLARHIKRPYRISTHTDVTAQQLRFNDLYRLVAGLLPRTPGFDLR
jgi:hypothetical protein